MSALLFHAATLPCTRCVLRHAVPEDAAAVASIYNDSIEPEVVLPRSAGLSVASAPVRAQERGQLVPFNEARARHWMQLHPESGRALWMACRDDQPVGWLSFLGLSDRPGMAYSSELAIYVSAAARGSGVGTTLLTTAVYQAASLGLDRLLAMVWSDNAASLHLFRRHGFVPWGRLPGVVWASGANRDMFVLGRQA